MPKKTVTTADITEGLRALGISAGERLMVHSSLSSLGYVAGGAPAVVDALLEVLGPEGTLMVPTFTHSATEYFDPLESPSKNGAITEAARLRPGALRSLHPTHAVTVIGPDAAELLEGDLECGALGKGCALDRLAKKGGHILLLGVSHKANSIIHVGEDQAGDPDRTKRWSRENPKRVILKHPTRGEEEVLLTSMMGSTVAFGRMEAELRVRGQLVEGKIGEADCQLMKGQDVIEATRDILRPILGA
jgi:aminoglycoside 3-N-acetyltransferase